jgi:hypothetical protein
VSKGHANYFLYLGHRKKQLGWNLLRDVLSRPKALTTLNLPSEGVKNQLCWLRWSDVPWCLKAVRTHFLYHGYWKKRFGRRRGCDVLSRPMAQRPQNLSSGSLKKQLWWSTWNDVSRLRKALRTHFLHPGHQKIRLWRSCLSDVLCRRMVIRTHNLPSGRLIKRLWWSRWRDVSRFRKA